MRKRSKKIFNLVFCSMIGACSLAMVGCNFLSPPHTHDYDADSWSKNADVHWHECSCGEKIQEAAHTYSEEMKYDDENHWYECVCGARTSEEEHKGGTATYTEQILSSIRFMSLYFGATFTIAMTVPIIIPITRPITATLTVLIRPSIRSCLKYGSSITERNFSILTPQFIFQFLPFFLRKNTPRVTPWVFFMTY